jgi:hypothetical protein
MECVRNVFFVRDWDMFGSLVLSWHCNVYGLLPLIMHSLHGRTEGLGAEGKEGVERWLGQSA